MTTRKWNPEEQAELERIGKTVFLAIFSTDDINIGISAVIQGMTNALLTHVGKRPTEHEELYHIMYDELTEVLLKQSKRLKDLS